MHTVDLALQSGRMLQRKQTGFVHFCHQSEDRLTHDTIPVLENALFALSLFRSRLSDNVLEGKGLIEKLLAFEVEGNFPTYLHEYPKCLDPYLGLRLLPVLFWITVDFSHVIGDLKEKLENCINRILAQVDKTDLPDWVQFRLDAFNGKIGSLPKTFYHWSEALISLQLAEKKGADITAILEEVSKLWHPELSLYTGPALRRHQDGHTPELSLFDLFLCQWQKKFPKRAEKLQAVHLRGALIRPLRFELNFPSKPVPYIHFASEEECPLFIAWETHTFVLAKRHLQVEGNAKELVLHLGEEEDDIGMNFFLDHHSDHEIFVNGEKATTFEQKDVLEIRSKELLIKLRFSVEDGRYLGVLMRGNRPSQHACRGEDHFTAFDWRIAIRTVSKGKAPIRVHLEVCQQMQESQQPLPLHASHYPHTELSQ